MCIVNKRSDKLSSAAEKEGENGAEQGPSKQADCVDSYGWEQAFGTCI